MSGSGPWGHLRHPPCHVAPGAMQLPCVRAGGAASGAAVVWVGVGGEKKKKKDRGGGGGGGGPLGRRGAPKRRAGGGPHPPRGGAGGPEGARAPRAKAADAQSRAGAGTPDAGAGAARAMACGGRGNGRGGGRTPAAAWPGGGWAGGAPAPGFPLILSYPLSPRLLGVARAPCAAHNSVALSAEPYPTANSSASADGQGKAVIKWLPVVPATNTAPTTSAQSGA